MNMMTETTFSHDSDLEEAVIGACMIERAAMPLVVDKLRPEMFYEEKNLEIFAALQSMYRSAKSIDTITLKNELAARGKLDAVGGPYELLRISSKVSSSAHLEYHALILRQLHTRRIMRTGFQQLLAFSADESMDIDDILVEAHRLLEGLEDESGVADHLQHDIFGDIDRTDIIFDLTFHKSLPPLCGAVRPQCWPARYAQQVRLIIHDCRLFRNSFLFGTEKGRKNESPAAATVDSRRGEW